MIVNFALRTFTPSLFTQQTRSASLLNRFTIKSIKEHLDKPKNAMNGYCLYYQEKYPEFKSQFPNFGVVDIARRIGNSWKAMDVVSKKHYNDRALKLNEQRRVDMKSYKMHVSEGQRRARLALHFHRKYARGTITRSEIPAEVKNWVKGLPATPFVSGHTMFLAMKLRGNSKSTQDIRQAQEQWSRLSAQEKKAYDDRAAADQAAFRDNFSKYIGSYDSK